MSEKYPNIKRPIETAPRDGRQILLWAGKDENLLIGFSNGYWSQMPEDEEPKYCCPGFSANKNIIKKRADDYYIELAVGGLLHTSFCPFCGEKLK